MESKEYRDEARYSQQRVQLSLKARLKFLGTEYIGEHDVSNLLIEIKYEFRNRFGDRVEEFASISRRLALQRGPSTYREERRRIRPSKLFGEKELHTKRLLGEVPSRSCKVKT